jgi:predicted nucleic acid-binding protein
MNAATPAWLDTNILLRYLTKDDPTLALRALAIIESDRPLLVSTAVLSECLFTLMKFYAVPRSVAIDTVSSVLLRANIHLPTIDKALALEALRQCRNSGRVGIVDALLWAEARTAGIPMIYTFDGRFPSEGVELRRSHVALR